MGFPREERAEMDAFKSVGGFNKECLRRGNMYYYVKFYLLSERNLSHVEFHVMSGFGVRWILLEKEGKYMTVIIGVCYMKYRMICSVSSILSNLSRSPASSRLSFHPSTLLHWKCMYENVSSTLQIGKAYFLPPLHIAIYSRPDRALALQLLAELQNLHSLS